MPQSYDLDLEALLRRNLVNHGLDGILPLAPTVRILVVVDPFIQVSPSGPFGVGRVLELLRNATLSWVRFQVDVAERGPQGADLADYPHQVPEYPRYLGFRFDSRDAEGRLLISRYDEIWCFGFEPSVHNSGSDQDIMNSSYNTDVEEMRALSDWMDAGGGLLAMGDHNMLGAAMC